MDIRQRIITLKKQSKKTGFLLPTLGRLYHIGGVLVNKIANIKLDENAVYIVKNGELEKVEVPLTGFGKQTINWQDGKLQHYEVSYTKR